MFFNSDLQVKVKKVLSLKKTKLPSYGKCGEFGLSGVKLRYYSLMSPKSGKYLTTSVLVLKWTPTTSHLLSGKQLEIRMTDRRSSDSDEVVPMLMLSQGASEPWVIKVNLKISVPLVEMAKGLPFLFDIKLPAENIKSGVEIGVLSFKFLMDSGSKVPETIIGPATLVNSQHSKIVNCPKNFLIWKDSEKGGLVDSTSTQIDDLLVSYLRGDINSEKFAQQIKNIKKA